MTEALERTRSARAEIESLITEQADLSERSKKQALKFVTGYYDLINDERRRSQALQCRQGR